MTSRKLIFSLTIIILVLTVSIVLVDVYYNGTVNDGIGETNTGVGGEGNYTSTPSVNASTTISNSSVTPEYRVAVDDFKSILEETREIYLNALETNETWKFSIRGMNFSSSFILNASIINETTLTVGGDTYRYVIVHLYDSEPEFSFTPDNIRIDDIFVKLSKNKTVTTTGGRPYYYVVSYNGKTYKVRYLFIGFFESSFYLTASTDKISSNIYAISITTTKKLGDPQHVNEAWVILVKQ